MDACREILSARRSDRCGVCATALASIGVDSRRQFVVAPGRSAQAGVTLVRAIRWRRRCPSVPRAIARRTTLATWRGRVELPKEFRVALAERYAIESQIAEGRMGAVFLANDLRHPR